MKHKKASLSKITNINKIYFLVLLTPRYTYPRSFQGSRVKD